MRHNEGDSQNHTHKSIIKKKYGNGNLSTKNTFEPETVGVVNFHARTAAAATLTHKKVFKDY